MAKKTLNPLAAALGASFLATSVVPTVMADGNPFAITELSNGYQLAGSHEDKSGEGNCGENKAESEGKCGESKAESEGKCGEGKAESEDKTKHEGKCGEAKCGANKTEG